MKASRLPRSTWLPATNALASGGLVALAAPGVVPLPAVGWLAWIAFVPLLVSIQEVSPRRAALLGWCAALVLNLVAAAWFPGLMARFNGLHPALAVAVAVLIAAVQSVGWAAWALSVRLLSTRWPLVLVAPVTFLAMEYTMPLVFPYSVALTQYRNLIVAQAAELGGPHLVSAMIVAFGAAVAGVIRSRRAAIRPAVMVAVFLAIIVGFGWFRLSQIRVARAQAPSMRVAWVQAGLVHTGWSPPAPDPDVLARYQNASAAIERANGPVELLIWPEKAYGLLLRNAKHDYGPDHPRRIRKGFESPLLFGLTSVDRTTRELGNAAALLGRDGQLRVVYEKVKLIPFSEQLPSWLEGKVPGGKRYRPGESLGPVQVPVSEEVLTGGEVPIGVFICFESTFPRHVRAIANGGARLLVNLSDDTWFGDSAEPEQHLAHVVFRAIENRRDIVRATGGGVSAVIAATGEAIHRTELNPTPLPENVGGVGEVRLLSTGSLYGQIGDSVPIACAIAWLLWMAGMVARSKPVRSF